MENQTQFFYITVGSMDEGKKIAAHLLEKKLIACANILPSHVALYTWQGQLEEGSEHIMILKSTAQNAETVIKEVKALHSYDCPCISHWNVKANSDFSKWVDDSTI